MEPTFPWICFAPFSLMIVEVEVGGLPTEEAGGIPTEEDVGLAAEVDASNAVEVDVSLAVGCFFFLPLTFEVSTHKEEACPVLGYLIGGCEGCLIGGC
ncbi:hypothetical protein RDI58_029106 [Solanum bulbocastanum]|uniref:Secreted protein n=1 Tax=Solanum bulbocastanum TaxID=147425 RepID=A0AAN8SW69_SOLBU